MKRQILLRTYNTSAWLGLILSLVVIGLLIAIPDIAHAIPAASLTVNSMTDTTIAGDGACTLREAITNADNDVDTTSGDCLAGNGDDTITFSLTTPATITLNSQLPSISNGSVITIVGPGPTAAALTISGNNGVRLLQADNGSTLSITTLTLADGGVSGTNVGGGLFNNGGTVIIDSSTIANNNALGFSIGGGGIYNAGTLSVTDTSLVNNNTLGSGGAVFNASSGSLTVVDSTISGNSTSGNGGGINNSGLVTIMGSTISGNSSTSGGGGIANFNSLSTTNSTISGNNASFGGGIYNYSTLTVTNNTLSDNSATNAGAGLFHFSGTTVLRNTIIANSINRSDCSGSITDGGSNLVEDGSCSLSAGDPLLGSLANNGGPTKTHALFPGSPAINTGNPVYCTATDQRGQLRVEICDTGAYEFSTPMLKLYLPLIFR